MFMQSPFRCKSMQRIQTHSVHGMDCVTRGVRHTHTHTQHTVYNFIQRRKKNILLCKCVSVQIGNELETIQSWSRRQKITIAQVLTFTVRLESGMCRQIYTKFCFAPFFQLSGSLLSAHTHKHTAIYRIDEHRSRMCVHITHNISWIFPYAPQFAGRTTAAWCTHCLAIWMFLVHWLRWKRPYTRKATAV